jgi:hypothetical protein
MTRVFAKRSWASLSGSIGLLPGSVVGSAENTPTDAC